MPLAGRHDSVHSSNVAGIRGENCHVSRSRGCFLDIAWLLVAKIMFSSAVGGSCQQRRGRGSGEDQEKNLLPEALLTFSLLGQIIFFPPLN